MTWTITHPSFTMTGPDPVPVINGQPPIGTTPPPVIGTTPPPQPPPDNSPYPFGPYIRPAYDYERSKMVWRIPGTSPDDPSGSMYAMENTGANSEGNPAGSSHGNALIIQGGNMAGKRLFAPYNAPPYLIRRVIATSQII